MSQSPHLQVKDLPEKGAEREEEIHTGFSRKILKEKLFSEF
jgi:hypothetical protein